MGHDMGNCASGREQAKLKEQVARLEERVRHAEQNTQRIDGLSRSRNTLQVSDGNWGAGMSQAALAGMYSNASTANLQVSDGAWGANQSQAALAGMYSTNDMGTGANRSAANLQVSDGAWGAAQSQAALAGMYSNQSTANLQVGDGAWGAAQSQRALDGMATVRNGRATPKQDDYVEQMQRGVAATVFKVADKAGNNNGKLSLEELKAYLETDEDVRSVLGEKVWEQMKIDDKERELDQEAFVDFYLVKCAQL